MLPGPSLLLSASHCRAPPVTGVLPSPGVTEVNKSLVSRDPLPVETHPASSSSPRGRLLRKAGLDCSSCRTRFPPLRSCRLSGAHTWVCSGFSRQLFKAAGRWKFEASPAPATALRTARGHPLRNTRGFLP
ncbi:hCG1980119 [Homo sapiens]|nr:hCG1980119 [Homo sapiens]